MGMHDYVRWEMPCPICKERLVDWETRSGANQIEELTPAELWEQRSPDPRGYDDNVDWYEYCGNCGTKTTITIQGCAIEDPDDVNKFATLATRKWLVGPDLRKARE